MFENRVIKVDKSEKFFNIVNNYIQEDFPALLNINIVFSMINPSRWKDKTHMISVKTFKFPSLHRDLFGQDFHVELSQEIWKNSGHANKCRLIWRGLRELGIEVDEHNKPKLDASGRIMLFLDKPDIEANFFTDEFLKFGPSGTLKSTSKTLSYLVERSNNVKV